MLQMRQIKKNQITEKFRIMLNVKTKILRLLAGAMLISAVSCVPSKKLLYMQNNDQLRQAPQEIVQNYELTIKPGDNLMVNLSTRDMELMEPFANSKILGTSANSSSSSNLGILVANDGTINLPVIGRVTIAGMKRSDAEKYIEKLLIDGEYIKDPVVNISFMNIAVSVLGEVSHPGQIKLSGERISILDALTAAGDLTPQGRRTNIMVYREVDGKRSAYQIDLTQSDAVFSSPCFYLQQNDVVYVEPNKAISVKGSPFLTYLGAGASVISVLASIVSLAIVLTK